MGRKTSKVYQISDEEFCQLIAESCSYSDCLRKLGLKTVGGSSTDALKARIKELGCSTEHFHPWSSTVKSGHAKPLEDILVENSTYLNISSLKKRLISAGLLEYKCAECGLSSWRGKPISLQLDHINGVHDDNRLENLRFLCPNCHSQTETFAGKNRKK